MKKAVAINDGKVLLEASGNVTKDNIRSVAETWCGYYLSRCTHPLSQVL